MLWDIIRDFFVQFIFGGCTSGGLIFNGFIGQSLIFTENNIEINSFDTAYGNYYIGDLAYDDFLPSATYLTIGDWLSTTFTIITLILICVFFLKFTIWMFKQGANLFKW